MKKLTMMVGLLTMLAVGVARADAEFERIADEAAAETDQQFEKRIESYELETSKVAARLNRYYSRLRDERGRFRRPETFLEQLAADTRREFGRSWNAGWIINFVGSESRLSAGTTVLAWKFLAVNPAITYIPDAADRRGELEIQFPIRLERIPIGGGRELGDLVHPERGTGGWYDHCVMRLVPSHNLSSGRFGFGVRVGLEF